MRSRFFGISSVGSPIGRLPSRPVEDGHLVSGVLDVTQDQSDLAADFQAPPTRAISRGCALLGSQGQAMVGTYCCDRLFTWATDQPRHATDTSTCPVEASSPPNNFHFKLSTALRKDRSRRAFGAFPRGDEPAGPPLSHAMLAIRAGGRVVAGRLAERQPPSARDHAAAPSAKPRDGSRPGRHATKYYFYPTTRPTRGL